MSAPRTLYLVDGTYLLFRAYHSLPPSMAVTGVTYQKNRARLVQVLEEGAGTLREPEGVAGPALAWLKNPARDRLPTNAVRGLTSVLLKLIRDEKPSYMGIAFDLPGRVHRDEAYDTFVDEHPAYADKLEGYKATRHETPVEILTQFPLARVVCGRALGIPVLEAPGFEADDVLATLARKGRDAGFRVRLVTADKDLFQLVDEGICILNPHKPPTSKASSYYMMDEKVVEADFGVPPDKVVDVLALMGDTSDNIPGVPGIGDKGAKDLIKRFGSVEGAIAAAQEENTIERATYRNGLREHAAMALLSKQLVTIRDDVPVDIALDEIWTYAPDPAALREVFQLLAFEGLLRETESVPFKEAMGMRSGGAAAGAAGGRAGAGAGAGAGSGPRTGAGTSAADAARAWREGAGIGESGANPDGRSAAASAAGVLERAARGEPRDLFSGAGEQTGGTAARPLPWDDAEAPSAPGLGAAPGRSGGRGGLNAGAQASADEQAGRSASDAAGGALSADAAPDAALDSAASAAEAADAARRYRAILDLADLSALVPEIMAAPRVAIGIETTSRDPMRSELVGIALAWRPNEGIYVPIAHRYLGAPAQADRAEVLRILAPLLESATVLKTGHDVKSAIQIFRRAGLRPAGFHFDTMIAGFMIESDRGVFTADSLAKEYLGETRFPPSETVGRLPKAPPFAEVEIETAARSAGRGADLTLRLAGILETRMASDDLRRIFDAIDIPLVDVLASMEMTGVRIDVDLLARMSREMGDEIAAIRAEIHRLAGHEFNIDSPRQLSTVLFEELKLPAVSRTMKSGVTSTRDEDLEVLAARHPLPARVRDYRVLAKLRSTYVDALPLLVNPATGRVHTSFHPTGAATGRLSSSDPNLQNIPIRTAAGRKVRGAFIPEEGWTLLSADYSQIELRVMAHLSQDAELIATFSRAEDIHRHTAARIFNTPYEDVTADQRRASKTINFGILYGMGPQRLSRELGITQSEAKELIASYFGRFPRIRDYIDRTIALAEEQGYVSTLFGRIRRFPHIISTSRVQRQLAIRAAVNSTIQGTAADMMKIAMVRLHAKLRELDMKTRLLIQVHDELVLEAPPEELELAKTTIREAMERIPPFEVPLTVDISSGKNWLEAKP